MTRILSSILVLFICLKSFTSDHIDGAATIADGQADLTDLYAFKTPNQEDSLTLILNTYPGVKPTGHFSSKVGYDIFIRQIESQQPPLRLGFHTLVIDELNINCTFQDPGHHRKVGKNAQGEVKCSLISENQLIDELQGYVGDTLKNENMIIFTGPRADPFFISSETFIAVTNRKEFKSTATGMGSNAMDTINVMTIALELNLKKLGLQNKKLALAAQSYTNRSRVYEALDRVGRPEITNLSLHDFSGKNPIKQKYNKLNPFVSPGSNTALYKARLIDNISAYDQLDSIELWSKSSLEILADILVDDFLVIDLAEDCFNEGSQFFQVEREMMLGLESTSCGGRKLTDDIMATLYALYIEGVDADLKTYDTGVSVPYQNNRQSALAANFPYLAPPETTSWKQWLLFKAAKYLQE